LASGILSAFILAWPRTAADLNEKMQAFLGGSPVAAVTSEQLTAIRQLRDQLFARWRAVAPGEALELEFTTA